MMSFISQKKEEVKKEEVASFPVLHHNYRHNAIYSYCK